MDHIEFEVKDIVPPRNVKRPSMWNNKTEIPRIIALRKMAYEHFKGREPFIGKIKLDIEIHIPQSYNEPGDLDNFIKAYVTHFPEPLDHSKKKPMKCIQNRKI